MQNVKLETFNNCPGRDEIIGYLETQFNKGSIEVTDSTQTFWQNNDDTLVFKVSGKLTLPETQNLYLMPWRKDADEFDTYTADEDGTQFVRIWWD